MGPIPGEAGVDFPVYNTVPDTGFDCAAQDNPGIYTDTEADCQVRAGHCETVKYFSINNVFIFSNIQLFSVILHVQPWG